MKWTSDLIGSLLGKTALVTGGSQGVGLEVARSLALHGAKVILCVEDVTEGEQALMELRLSMYGGDISYDHVDLADINSIKYFTEQFIIEHQRLDLLINCAEISSLPHHLTSAQGHEMMLAKNFLATFALTANLFSLIEQAEDGRVIFQISADHNHGELDFFDLEGHHIYDPRKAYAQSQLALLVLAKELDRRLKQTHINIKSIPVERGEVSFFARLFYLNSKENLKLMAHPLLYAAASADIVGGHFYGGKAGAGELATPLKAKNVHAAEKLWRVAEEMCGVEFNLLNMSNILPFQIRGNIVPDLFT